MKLEYLYTDDSYKEKIADLVSEAITLSEKKKDNLYVFTFSIDGESDDKAKNLSDIHSNVLKKLEDAKLFVLSDEAAEYFNKNLYPLFNKFERLFRKVIYLISNKKTNEKALQQAKQLEALDFGQIYTVFFTDSKYLIQVKNLINKTPLSKKDLIEKLKEEKETTLWKELFGSKYSEIPNSFFKIKDARNDVMHAHNITYSQYSDTKSTIIHANSILQKIIDDILTDKAQIKTEGLDSLLKTFTALSKLLSENVLGAYHQQLESISKSLSSFSDITSKIQIPKYDYSALNALSAIQIPQINYGTLNALGTIQMPHIENATLDDSGVLHIPKLEHTDLISQNRPTDTTLAEEKKDD